MQQRSQADKADAIWDDALTVSVADEASTYAALASRVDDVLEHVTISPYLSSPTKRLFDLVVAVPLMIASLPFLIGATVASAFSFRAWPIFTQVRMGRGGEPFRMVKVRSLPARAPKYADKYAVAEMGTTRVGSWLRKTKLDELPQLMLVLTGRMSLVGPRPEMHALCENFDPAFVVRRTAARPGCAGLWQISEDAHRLIGEVPQYDLAYLERASVRVDLAILWHTARMVIGGDAVDVAEIVGVPLETPSPLETHALAG